MSDHRTQVLIVGGGLAGLEAARELFVCGVSDVTVVEQGPSGDGDLHNNAVMSGAEALEAWLGYDADPYFLRSWHPKHGPHYGEGSGERALLGGRSRYWYGVVLPLESWALADWPESVVADLSAVDGSGLYEEVLSEILRPAVSQDRGPTIRGAELWRTPRARSGIDGEKWFAYSPLDHWRDPVSGARRDEEPDTTILTGCRVERIVVSDGRVEGVDIVDGEGRRQRYLAPLVVLAAGTIPNARLALEVLPSRGEVGGITDHIVQGFWLSLRGSTAEALLSKIPLGSWWRPLDDETRSNLFIEVEPGEQAGVRLDIRVTGEQTRSVQNTVSLPDGTGTAVIDVTTFEEDDLVIARQRAVLQDVWDELSDIAGLPSSVLEFADYDAQSRGNSALVDGTLQDMADGTAVTWSSFLGTEDHESGTLAIGDVVGENLEFADVRGLFAAGPCVFPRAGAANPSLTTIALSRRLARHIAHHHAARTATKTKAGEQ